MQIFEKTDKKTQAIIAYRKMVIEGKSEKQTALEMGMSVDTVQRRMAFGRKYNIFTEFEQKIYDELIPLAHEALKMALEDGDAQIALKIYQGKQLLGDGKNTQKTVMDVEEEDFYGEIAKLRSHAIDVEAIESPGTEISLIPSSVPGQSLLGISPVEKSQEPVGSENAPIPVEQYEQLRLEF